MNTKFEPSYDEIMAEIDKCVKRMKHADSIKDKVGYDIALKEYQNLHKKYAHILYKKREPTAVFDKRL